MGKIPVALQLYSLRDVIPYDVEGTLASVAKMGYQGVEFAGYYGKSAKELRGILDDNGLLVAGTHIGLETLLGDEFDKTVEFNQELGNKFLIVPGLAEERRNSVKAWKDTAKIFNDLAEKVKPFGMRVGYHNHWDEFKAMEGQLPFDVSSPPPWPMSSCSSTREMPYMAAQSRCLSSRNTRDVQQPCTSRNAPVTRR